MDTIIFSDDCDSSFDMQSKYKVIRHTASVLKYRSCSLKIIPNSPDVFEDSKKSCILTADVGTEYEENLGLKDCDERGGVKDNNGQGFDKYCGSADYCQKQPNSSNEVVCSYHYVLRTNHQKGFNFTCKHSWSV